MGRVSNEKIKTTNDMSKEEKKNIIVWVVIILLALITALGDLP